jgi:hypothetical protein
MKEKYGEKMINEQSMNFSSSCQEDMAPGNQADSKPLCSDTELGLTVERLTDALNLPAEFIRGLGLSDNKRKGIQVVTIPYLDEKQECVAVRHLQSLYGITRFAQPPLRVVPYGFWRIGDIKRQGRVLLVPSEKDCWVCWHIGIPALGLPDTVDNMENWLDHLKDLEVFLWDGNLDRGFLSLMNECLPGLQVLQATQDNPFLWGAYVQGKDLRALISEAKESVSHASTVLQTWRESQVEKLRQSAMSVLVADDPILVIEEAIRSLGYGGDIKAALITYLAATSRVLSMRTGSMPVHLLLKGAPSSGKSYTLQIVLRLLPEEASYRIDAGSLRVLIFDPEANLHHRVVIFSEADSLPKGEDNPAASALRTLMQENRLSYKVTISESSTGQFTVQEVSKPGPSVVITTSTKGLGPQLDSRVFTVEVSDSSEQIQAALTTQALLELEGAPEPDPALIAFQALLQIQAPWEVVVPFADKLSKKIGQLPHASRLNRDFARLLSLIKVVAVLRSDQREVDDQQRVIATLDDYATVHSLVNEVYETSVTKVSDTVREVIAAVGELKQRGNSSINQSDVARHLGISRQRVHPAVRTALNQSWLVNSETRKGYPANLDLGEPLPEALGLPKLQELVAEEDGEVSGLSMDNMEASEPSAPISDEDSDASESWWFREITPGPTGEQLSSNGVKMFPDGNFQSTGQASPVKCSDCEHLIALDDCFVTFEDIQDPSADHFCEHFSQRPPDEVDFPF